MRAYWAGGVKGMWDQGLLIHSLAGHYGTPVVEESLVPNGQEIAVACGAWIQNHQQHIPSGFPVLVHTSDESHVWDSTGLSKIRWMQYPTQQHQGDRNVIIGCPEDTQRLIAERTPLKNRRLDWVFSGQVNHALRQDMANNLSGNGEIWASEGFSKGLPREQHLKLLSECKIAPCPSGLVHPDSFRLWESLEAGCFPVVDSPWFWQWMGIPVTSVNSWSEFPFILEMYKDEELLQKDANRIGAWYVRYKHRFARNLLDDAGGVDYGKVTVLITSSRLSTHPDTTHIDNCIKSIHCYLPDVQIIIMLDGQGGVDYEEYKRRVIDKCNYTWKNVTPLVFDKVSQQAIMTKEALKYVKTPYLLFMEHDTTLEGEIPFENLISAFQNPEINSIRFFHYHEVHPDHKHLIGDVKDMGVPLRKTYQWSQRPHLARTDWYRWVMETYFKDEVTFIEERMFYVCRDDNWTGWDKFGMWIYSPQDMCRSGHSYGDSV